MKSKKTPTTKKAQGRLPDPINHRAGAHTFTEQPALPPKRQIQAASPALDKDGRLPRTPGTGGRKA